MYCTGTYTAVKRVEKRRFLVRIAVAGVQAGAYKRSQQKSYPHITSLNS
jgi:hypothetical protein